MFLSKIALNISILLYANTNSSKILIILVVKVIYKANNFVIFLIIVRKKIKIMFPINNLPNLKYTKDLPINDINCCL